MIKVGDMVKVIDKCDIAMGIKEEIIPIGTICEVKEVTEDNCYGMYNNDNSGLWYYTNKQVMKV